MSAVSKVVLGNQTVMDITDSTVNANNLLSGAKAYGSDGEPVIGSVVTSPQKVFYGTCDTSASSQAKTATVSSDQNFSLATGVVVYIRFTNTNTYSVASGGSITLEVNSTGAKTITYGAEASPTGTAPKYYGTAKYTNCYIYDGTRWVWQGSTVDSDTTYSSKAESQGGTDVSLVTTGDKYTWNRKMSDNPTFTEASTRANIASGESFSTILGKIKKFFTDLKTVAFTGSYSDLTDQPTIPTIPGVVSTSANGLAPKITDTSKYLKGDGTWSSPPNTTYTFAGGTNKFTVTPSGGTAQDVTVTPSITNNVTGSGTSGYIAKFNGANTITNGPAFGSSTGTFLRNDGTWVAPQGTTYDVVSKTANGLAPQLPNETTTTKYLRQDGTWVVPPNNNNRRSFYGTCSTAAATAAKEVTLSSTTGWELVEGTIVGVTFTNDNTASNVTLNVNGTGAKSIWYESAVFTGNTTWITGRANRTIFYMYDGTYWRWINFNWHSDGNDKVTQSNTNTTNWRKVVLGHQDDASPGTATTTTTNQVYVNPNVEVQSTSGRIRFKAHNELITGSGTAGQDKGEGVSPRYFPAKWTYNLGVAPMDGDNITIKIPVAGHNYGVYVSINNGTNYHPVVLNGTGRLTTHFPNATYVTLVFESGGSAANIMPLNGGDAATTVSGGVWRVINYYDSNSNVTQTATSTNANYEVLFSATADNTTRTEGARKYSNLKFNPSTGNLQTTQLNGVTIGSSPKFTDNNTTYTFAQGDNAGTIKVTPSDGSASNISVKPFDLSIAADSGTSALTMAASTKYKLTAGGSSFIFTSTPNTWRGIQNNLTSDETAQSLSAAQGKALANGSARDSTKLPLAGGTMTGKITSAKANNFYATGSGTAAQDKGSGVSPRYFPAKWTFNTGENASNGDTIIIKVPVAGHSYGVFVSINNGTNYYPVAVNYSTSRLQTHYPNGAIIQLVFDSSGTVNDVFALNGGDARTNVSGGCWRILNWYDTNNVPSAYCDTAAGTAAKTASCSGYSLLSKSFIQVIVVNTNTSASALTLNINGKGAKPIYINGTASSSSNYTLTAGSYLVYYNGTNYYFRTDGKLTASITGDAATVNGKTVGVNVPSNAVFTDTSPTLQGGGYILIANSVSGDQWVKQIALSDYNVLETVGTASSTAVKILSCSNYHKDSASPATMYAVTTQAIDSYMSQSKTLSTTADTTFTFTNNAITTSSVVEVYSSIYGVNPKSVTCSSGSCAVVFGPYTSATSLTCRIDLKWT